MYDENDAKLEPLVCENVHKADKCMLLIQLNVNNFTCMS